MVRRDVEFLPLDSVSALTYVYTSCKLLCYNMKPGDSHRLRVRVIRRALVEAFLSRRMPRDLICVVRLHNTFAFMLVMIPVVRLLFDAWDSKSGTVLVISRSAS